MTPRKAPARRRPIPAVRVAGRKNHIVLSRGETSLTTTCGVTYLLATPGLHTCDDITEVPLAEQCLKCWAAT
jgi:hypothetical protein